MSCHRPSQVFATDSDYRPSLARSNAYAKSAAEHARHHAKLKKYEQRYLAERGENVELGIAAKWGRFGARWTGPENTDLVQHFRDLISEDGTKRMGFRELCELAWNHGRSAAAVETQLRKLIGWKEFYKYFEFV